MKPFTHPVHLSVLSYTEDYGGGGYLPNLLPLHPGSLSLSACLSYIPPQISQMTVLTKPELCQYEQCPHWSVYTINDAYLQPEAIILTQAWILMPFICCAPRVSSKCFDYLKSQHNLLRHMSIQLRISPYLHFFFS